MVCCHFCVVLLLENPWWYGLLCFYEVWKFGYDMSPLYLLFSQSCIPLLLSSLSCVFPCACSVRACAFLLPGGMAEAPKFLIVCLVQLFDEFQKYPPRTTRRQVITPRGFLSWEPSTLVTSCAYSPRLVP